MALLVVLVVVVTLGEVVVLMFKVFVTVSLGFARLTGLVLIKVFALPKPEPENEK